MLSTKIMRGHILIDNNKVSTYKSLNEIETILPSDSFVRIHAKYIVNLVFIKNFNTSTDNDILLIDGTKLKISRRKKKHLLDKFVKL